MADHRNEDGEEWCKLQKIAAMRRVILPAQQGNLRLYRTKQTFTVEPSPKAPTSQQGIYFLQSNNRHQVQVHQCR